MAPDDKSSPKEVERVSYWLSALRRAASKAMIIISDLGVGRFIFCKIYAQRKKTNIRQKVNGKAGISIDTKGNYNKTF